jgi:hypothetical protein
MAIDSIFMCFLEDKELEKLIVFSLKLIFLENWNRFLREWKIKNLVINCLRCQRKMIRRKIKIKMIKTKIKKINNEDFFRLNIK